MCLRLYCSLDICLFYCISKARTLKAGVFFSAPTDTDSNMKHIFKSIQRMRTFSLINLCVLQSKNHLQKCLLFPESWEVTLKIRLMQFFFCAGLCQSVSCLQKRLYRGAFFSRPFPLSFSTWEMPCLLLTKKSQMELTFLGDVS